MCIIEPGFFKTPVTNLETLERELHRLWNQLSPEVKDSYGDKYLDKCKYRPKLCFCSLFFLLNIMCQINYYVILKGFKGLI